MMIYKTAPAVLLLVLVVRADKKIELQDIEEDNLKSEKEKDLDKNDVRPQSSGSIPLDFLKSGLFRFFDNQVPAQQPRYVQQYAVTEPPEKPPTPPKQQQHQQYPSGPAAQQAMVGYLSNVPMQIYLVPQYYNEPSEQASNGNPGIRFTAPASMPRASAYTAPEAAQPQANYIEVPAYMTPTGRAYLHPQQYQPQVTYVTYTPQPAVASASPQMAVVTTPTAVAHQHSQVYAYQMPLVQYPTAIASPPVYPKSYYSGQQQAETNTIEEAQENEIESPKQYASHTESPYTKSPEFPRYYTSRAPLREEHRQSPVQELPPPSPLLLRGSPPHLAHIPRVLPYYRPLSKPVYAPGGVISNAITSKPSDAYGVPYRKRPNSLLDSYIPSHVQLEYLKRGYAKDPLSVYDALSSRNYPVSPRHYERGFLPNQMYHTAAGGVTYGHYKRTAKPEKLSQ